jgi:hypothetical protein
LWGVCFLNATRPLASWKSRTYAAAFERGLPTGDMNPPRSRPPPTAGVHCGPSPDPPGSSWWHLEGRWDAGFSRTPFRLACRTRAVWQYRPVVVVAASHPHRRLPDQAAPSFARLLRQPRSGALSSPRGFMAPRGARCPRARVGSAPPRRSGARPRRARAAPAGSATVVRRCFPRRETPCSSSLRISRATRLRPTWGRGRRGVRR